MPLVYAIDGLVPVVDPSAFVHPSAVLIGDVIVGPRAYIGPCASLRGDFGRIVVEEGANIQDHCTMHGFPGKDTVAPHHRTRRHPAWLRCPPWRPHRHERGVQRQRRSGRGRPAARVLRELSPDEMRWK